MLAFLPASGVPCPGSKEASVKIIHVLLEALARTLGSSQVNIARYKLNALIAFGITFYQPCCMRVQSQQPSKF